MTWAGSSSMVDGEREAVGVGIMEPDLSFLDAPDFGLPSYFCPPQTVEVPTSPDFLLPPNEAPKAFHDRIHKDPHTSEVMDFAKGTTTLAFKFQHGILVAVDARATMGGFISSNNVRKVIEINDYLLGTMAGGAADCMYWEHYLSILCRNFQLKHNEKISVAGAASMLSSLVGQYKGYGLSMGTMIAGVDFSGHHLYLVLDDGTKIEGKRFSVGSGSPYAYGVLDQGYRWDLSLAEAVELGRKAIYQAGHRDAMSGGVVRIYHVHETGWTKITEAEDLMKIHDEEMQAKGMVGFDDEAGLITPA